MSYSRDTVAHALQRRPRGPILALATVMGLPLLDGLFPTLVLAGALAHPVGILEVGLLVFGGSATVAIVLAELAGSRRERVLTILAVGALVVPVAALEAALAPTLRSVLNLGLLKWFAALVVLTVAARTASASVADWLPHPGIVVAVGLVASLDPTGARLAFAPDSSMVLGGAAAAGVGVALALAVAVAAPWLRAAVDLDRFRFGSAVALGVLALSLVGYVPADSPLALAVLAVTALLSFDPGPPAEGSARARLSERLPDSWAVAAQSVLAREDTSEPEDSPPGRFPTAEWSDEDRPPWL